MKTQIEVAQINTQTDSYSKKLNVGDKREWYWQDNTQEDLLIVRKCQPEEVLNTSYESSEDSGYDFSGSASEEDGFKPGYKR